MAVRDPLLVPLAAIVGGIVYSRALQVDLKAAALAFALLLCLIFVSVRWISREVNELAGAVILPARNARHPVAEVQRLIRQPADLVQRRKVQRGLG